MKVSAVEYARAIDGGKTARRAGHKKHQNPYKHDNTDKGRLLSEAWDNGYEREDGRRKR